LFPPISNQRINVLFSIIRHRARMSIKKGHR
jgi:hypothetical protein